MMKAVKNFMNKPLTWGTCFKLSGIVMGVYAALAGAHIVWLKWSEKKELDEMKESNLEENEF